MRDHGKILALAHTVQAGASLCLVQKLPVPLVSLSACKAGRPRTVEGAMCPSRWHASVCPGLIAVFPCVFWLPLLFTGRFQHIAASLQMSTPTLLLCSLPDQSVPYLSWFSVPGVLGYMLALVCVFQEVGSFSTPFLLVPCHCDPHLQYQCLNTFLESFPASCWDELG